MDVNGTETSNNSTFFYQKWSNNHPGMNFLINIREKMKLGG